MTNFTIYTAYWNIIHCLHAVFLQLEHNNKILLNNHAYFSINCVVKDSSEISMGEGGGGVDIFSEAMEIK